MGEAASGDGVGREEVGHVTSLAHGLGDAFQPHEGRVGCRRERESRRHDREQVGQHLPDTPRRIDEAPQHVVGAGGLGEAEPPQQLLGRRPVGAVTRMQLRRPGERFQQGPVEQPLVDRTDEPGRAFILRGECVGVGEVERTGERGARVPVGRQVVGLQVPDDLQAMLHTAQEPVGVGEGRGIGVGNVPLDRQGREGGERVRRSQSRVAAPVHDLQQLDRELDVADAAPPPLDLDELLAPLADVLLEAHLRAAHVLDRGRCELGRIHERRDAVDEPPPELVIARDRPRLDHRLPFPGGGLPLVVGEGRFEGTAEGAGSTSRSQGDVDAQSEAIGGRLGEHRGHEGHRPFGRGLRSGAGVAMQEQQVDVARVVQLGPAELAEADHGESGAVDQGEGLRDARVCDRADLGDDVVECAPRQIPGGHPKHRPPPEPPEAGGGSEPVDVAGELRTQRAALARRDVGERRDLVRMGDEDIGRGPREAQEPSRHFGDFRACERLARDRVVADARERHAGEFGIGRVGEGPAEHLGRQHAGIIAPTTSPAGRSRVSPVSGGTSRHRDRALTRRSRRTSIRRPRAAAPARALRGHR